MHTSCQERSVSPILLTLLTLLASCGVLLIKGMSRRLLLLGASFFAPATLASTVSQWFQADNPALLFSLLILVLVIGGGLLTLLFHHLEASSFRRLHGQLTLMPVAVALGRKKDCHLIYGNKP